MSDVPERSEPEARYRVASHALFDFLLIQGALDSLGVALADHHHQWSEGEREIYEQSVIIISSWIDDCKDSDSSASEKYCSQQLLREHRLQDARASVRLLASECSLWRVASVVLLLLASIAYQRFRCFCSSCCIWVRIFQSNVKVDSGP